MVGRVGRAEGEETSDVGFVTGEFTIANIFSPEVLALGQRNHLGGRCRHVLDLHRYRRNMHNLVAAIMIWPSPAIKMSSPCEKNFFRFPRAAGEAVELQMDRRRGGTGGGLCCCFFFCGPPPVWAASGSGSRSACATKMFLPVPSYVGIFARCQQFQLQRRIQILCRIFLPEFFPRGVAVTRDAEERAARPTPA